MSWSEIIVLVFGLCILISFWRLMRANQRLIVTLREHNNELNQKNVALLCLLKTEKNHSLATIEICRSFMIVHGECFGINNLSDRFDAIHQEVFDKIKACDTPKNKQHH